MAKGAEHEDVQALISEHYTGIRFFYDCPIEMYHNLGMMYHGDPRFASHYNKFAPGLAGFIKDAIDVFCKNHESQ